MLLSDISVKRPVLATVLSMILVVFGIVSYQQLSLREYPDIDPPVVTVDVNYPGAPANIVETRVTELIEERIAGIEGIEFIESSSEDGESQVTIEFKIDRDIDAAANDIRDRISGIQDNLPEEADPPEVQKTDSNDDVIIWRNLASDRHTVPELTDFAERFLVDRYSTLDGVARIRVGGGLRYAVRVWLDRNAMAARNLTVTDVERALRAENVELPAGSLESSTRLFQARVERNFTDIESFKQLTLAEGGDGDLVRLGNIARVELGVEEDRTFFRGNTETMVGIGTIRQSTANTIEVATAVKDLTARINPTLPEGMEIKESYDESVFIEAAISEVYQTLFIAVFCVILVIYLFLGSARAMLIPALTVPISLTATFIVINAFGFSINLLTLLALVLAIGLVVDDAIVMLENIVRRIREYEESPLVAAYRGARQVGFAVISTTLVLVSVFVPITFLDGDLGSLFKEFAITIAAAISFSSIVALTLSPMLASKLLSGKKQRCNIVIRGFDRFMNLIREAYMKALGFVLRTPILVSIFFLVTLLGTVWIYQNVEEEFTPTEDRGVFAIIVNAPEGASYEYTRDYMSEIERRVMPYVESGEVRRLLVRTPRSFGNFSNFNTGICIVILEDWSKRRPAQVIMNEIRADLGNLPGVRAFPVMRQAFGGGNRKPVQFVLGGSTYEELAEWRDIIIERTIAENPNLIGLDSDYKETRPQLDVRVDYARASELGVTVSEIGRTLETMMGGRNVTTFLDRGEEYEVVLEGERNIQRSINDMENIYVRSDRTDELIPLSNLVYIEEFGAAQTLSRYNRVRSITLEANLAEGYRLGEALAYLEKVVREELPEEAIIDYKGQSRDYVNAGSSIIFVFLMGLAVVFLVLSAQFESFVHPFVIMLTVPATIGGGLLGLYLTGNSLNIYSQIGLIMLVGLAAKNGILIVEFANQLRDEGIEFSKALTQACEIRLRPVLMTGVTTIAGSIPLILASGAGSETRIVIGVVVLFGVFVATLLTLFIIPVAYNLLAKHTGSPNAVGERLEKETQLTKSL